MKWTAYFEKWAPNYEKEVKEYGYKPEKLIKPFLKEIGKRKSGLDVGCGTGISLQTIKTFCKDVVGVEPVKEMAKQAEAKGFRVLNMKAENIGKIKEKFDFISFFASIDFSFPPEAAKGCRKILEKDGLVFVTIEPENEHIVIDAFYKQGFILIGKTVMQAYRGHDYICTLFK